MGRLPIVPTLCGLHTSKHNYFSCSAFWAGIRVWQMLLVTFLAEQAPPRHNENEIEISSICRVGAGGGRAGPNRLPLRGWGTWEIECELEVEARWTKLIHLIWQISVHFATNIRIGSEPVLVLISGINGPSQVSKGISQRTTIFENVRRANKPKNLNQHESKYTWDDIAVLLYLMCFLLSTSFSSSSAWLFSSPSPRLMLSHRWPPMLLRLLWPMLLLPLSTRRPFHVPTPPTLLLHLSTLPPMWHLQSTPHMLHHQSTPHMPHQSPPMPLLPLLSPRCWRSKSINPSPHTTWYPNLDYVQINWAQIKIDKRFLFGWR